MKSQKARLTAIRTDVEMTKYFFINRILIEATNTRELKQLVEWELNKYVCIRSQIRRGSPFQWYLGDCFQYGPLLVNSRIEMLLKVASYMGYVVYTDKGQSNIWINGSKPEHLILFTNN